MDDRPRIYCNSIPYRSGVVEVCANIHLGHVNIEIWNLDPDRAQSATDSMGVRITDADVTANTEIELEISQAKELVRLLSSAIELAEGQADT